MLWRGGFDGLGKIRANKISPEKPDGWPKDIRAISVQGLNLLGIDEKTGRLYWDGKEIVMRTGFFLGTFERWVAGIAASAAAVTAVVNVMRLWLGK
jgi:hypothetical protein